ncbi:DinB family protein [Telluribacter sp. SYSU D00476]|uniref:DinB family protein n=1 Tax=Telluribacter sp. SYSU D00476 TaxID=2811430 RepID=UPI001FF3A221|nr:DinB family protein [Telluribacter sp. SYSU D00476]
MIKRNFHIPFGHTADHSLDYLLGILDDVRVTTLQRVAGCTTQELDWQYREGWNTIGALLSHMTALDHYFRIEYLERRSLTEEENERWLPALDLGPYVPQLISNQPLEVYIAEMEESRHLLLEALKNLTFEDFQKRIAGYDPVEGCNLAWVLYHMAEDELHHRGQISILRKLYRDSH